MITGREIAAHDSAMRAVAAREAALRATPRSLLPFVGKAGGAPFPFNQIIPGGTGGLEKVDQPYAQSVWVSRAISMIAGEIAGLELEFLDAAGVELEDPALAEFWRAPALGPDKRRVELDDVVAMLVTWWKLEGEFFLVLGDEWLTTFGERQPFIVARPDRMSHIVRGGQLVAWRFQDASLQRITLLPEQVVHVKRMNPYDDFRGLSEFQAAEVATNADYLAGKFNLNLMRNNGDQGVYIIAKNGTPLGEEQREQIVRDVRMKREMSLRGQFRPLFLTGDIAIEDAKMQVPDAAFVSVRMENRHEVLFALGVPPSFGDVKAAYSIGSDSDRHMLVTSTAQPVSRKLCSGFRQVALRQNPKVASAAFDWDEHPVMQAVRRERVDTGLKLWGTGMPMDLVSEYLSLGLPDYPGSDRGYLPFSVAPVESDGSTQDPKQSADAAEEGGPVGAMMRALLRRRYGLDQKRECKQVAPAAEAKTVPDDLRIFFCSHPGCAAAEPVQRSAAELARWRDFMAKRRETLKQYENRINRVLFAARSETLAKLERLHRTPVAGRKAAAGDVVFDLGEFGKNFFAAMQKQHRLALDRSGKQFFEEIGKTDPFAWPPEAVLEYARTRENKLSQVPDEIHAKVKEELEQGFIAGETTEQLGDRVRAAFGEISRGRARTIASTETGAAYGAGRARAMREAGVPRKAWLTSGNSNVRAAHAEAGREYSRENAIPVDQAFFVDGEELMFPGDSSGSPENVINCHCVSFAVEAEAEA